MITQMEKSWWVIRERWPSVSRYHHQFRPDLIEHEPDTFSPAEISALEALGHQLKSTGRQYGNQQVLYWHKKDGKISAAGDPRGIGTTVITPVVPQ